MFGKNCKKADKFKFFGSVLKNYKQKVYKRVTIFGYKSEWSLKIWRMFDLFYLKLIDVEPMTICLTQT